MPFLKRTTKKNNHLSDTSRIKKNSFLAKFSSYTFLYIPNESGATRKFHVPKILVFGGLFLFVTSLGACLALSLHAKGLGNLQNEYERLKAENHSIRSEAAALIAKLHEVQDNLSRVDKFSTEVRRETSQIDPSEAKSKKIKSGLNLLESQKKKAPLKEDTDAKKQNGSKQINSKELKIADNIGPLTKEEFEFSKSEGNANKGSTGSYVKTNSLEFKNIFRQIDEIRSKSSNQADSLSFLLGELQLYRQKLASTPTISPVDGLVTSIYGVRISPITGQNRMHQGLDIAAPMGSSINAAAQGTVTKIGYAEDYGNFVEITHGYGVLSRYAHAKSIDVKVGTKVNKGDHIGKVGMTGRTTGPHLHYELQIGGKKIDPSNFIANY